MSVFGYEAHGLFECFLRYWSDCTVVFKQCYICKNFWMTILVVPDSKKKKMRKTEALLLHKERGSLVSWVFFRWMEIHLLHKEGTITTLLPCVSISIIRKGKWRTRQRSQMWRTMYCYCTAALPFCNFFIESTPDRTRTTGREPASNTVKSRVEI